MTNSTTLLPTTGIYIAVDEKGCMRAWAGAGYELPKAAPNTPIGPFVDITGLRAALAVDVQPVALDHIACIEGGELRYMTGRKAPAHDCELYAMPDGGRAPKLYAAPAAQAAPAAVVGDEFTDSARAALLWVLWHHQGGSSPVGQPLRFALGMDAHERLTESQIAEAKRWAESTGSTTSQFHAATVARPVATLHDDGCFTWKSDEFRLKYDRQRAGWRMDVYAASQPAPVPVPAEPLFADPLVNRLKGLKVLLGTDSPEVRGWAPVVRRNAEAILNAAIALLQGRAAPTAPVVQPGWQWVPVEPTPQMLKAAVVSINGNAVYKSVAIEALRIEEAMYGGVYEAMLAAAPQPQAPKE